MAKIESYALAPSPISGSDKLIGTDTANNNATKNFTVNQLISYVGLNGGFVPYTGAVADINLGNRGIFGSVGVFSSLVQASNVNVLGGLLINSSAGTAGQVLVSQGIGNRPIWSSSVVTGPQGIQGPIGPQGVPGPAGPAGLNWRSSWVSGTSYIADDAVAYGGASWFCILATSGTTTPDLDTTHWALLASQGAQGPAGATGAQGPTGATGATGAPGPTGTQTLQQVLDFDHTLTNGRNYQGTLAGSGSTGFNVNAFGENAAQSNTQSNVNALGFQAGLGNIGSNLNALGNSAGTSNGGSFVNAFGILCATSNSGSNINAIGSTALYQNSGSNVNALGDNVGVSNTYSYVNLFGYNATATNIDQTVLAGQNYMARLQYAGLTANRLYTFPDKSGTFAMLSDITSVGSWSTLGNAGLGPANFIGTTDNVNVNFKVNGGKVLTLSTANATFGKDIIVQGGANSTSVTANQSPGGATSSASIGQTTTEGGYLDLVNITGFTTRLKATNANTARFIELPNESGTLAIQKYTSYVATLTQNGLSDPIAVVLENTTGLTITWTYFFEGRYFAEFSSPIPPSKTFILVGSSLADDTVTFRYSSVNGNLILISSKDNTNNFKNGTLQNTTIEVRIYP
jgi:hypothetical protein